MRIISQDGTLDLPYEGIGITTGHKGDGKEFYIFAHLVNSAEPKKDPQKLGTYSTEAKAQKAMEMLHNTYYEHEAEKIYHEGNNYIHPTFQFPADEDAEV